MLRSIGYWFWHIVMGQHHETAVEQRPLRDLMYEALRAEVPRDLEITPERVCNLQCSHCFFQEAMSSKPWWDSCSTEQVILNIARQLPEADEYWGTPALIHGGRILQKWHLPLLEKIRQIRPDVEVSLIDNGTYVRHLDEILAREIRVARLDLSLDGLEGSHNLQRDPEGRLSGKRMPWAVTMEGFRHARLWADRVSAPMTLTNINYREVVDVAEAVLGGDTPLADEFHLTIVGIKRPPLEKVRLTPTQLSVAWEGYKEACRRYNTSGESRVFFRLFTLEDLAMLKSVVGARKLWEAMTRLEGSDAIWTRRGNLIFTLDGVEVSFFPLSIWPHEAFLIDSDAWNRMVYMQKFNIDELRTNSDEVAHYNVSPLTGEEDYRSQYSLVVDKWLSHFGPIHYAEERKFFECLRLEAREGEESLP